MQFANVFIFGANLTCIALQVFVLIFEIGRLNEKLGALLSFVVSFSWFLCFECCTARFEQRRRLNNNNSKNNSPYHNCCSDNSNDNCNNKSGVPSLYCALLLLDFAVICVNVLLLAYFQWLVMQYCVYLNVSVALPANVSCFDWWHFGEWRNKHWLARNRYDAHFSLLVINSSGSKQLTAKLIKKTNSPDKQTNKQIEATARSTTKSARSLSAPC